MAQESEISEISGLSNKTDTKTFSKTRNSLYETDFRGWMRWWSSILDTWRAGSHPSTDLQYSIMSIAHTL